MRQTYHQQKQAAAAKRRGVLSAAICVTLITFLLGVLGWSFLYLLCTGQYNPEAWGMQPAQTAGFLRTWGFLWCGMAALMGLVSIPVWIEWAGTEPRR